MCTIQVIQIEAAIVGGEIMSAVGHSQAHSQARAQDQAVERSMGALTNALPNAPLGGTPVTVRPAQPSDVVLIQEMHTRLSKESLYYRYLAAHPPSPEDLQRLCFLDGGPGVAMVATVEEPQGQEKVVAMACYCVDPGDPTTAEPAVLVEDSYQGRRLGKRIGLALCKAAREKINEEHAFSFQKSIRALTIRQP